MSWEYKNSRTFQSFLKKNLKPKNYFEQMLIWNKLMNLKMDEITSMEDFLVHTKDLLN